MKINQSTLYEEIESLVGLFTDDDKKRLKDAAIKFFYPDSFWSIKIRTFIAGISGQLMELFEGREESDPFTAFEYFLLEAFTDFVSEFSRVIENYSIRPTAEESQASEGLPETTLQESMLVFCRSYFSLKSFDEASDLLLSDYLIAKKDDYTRKMYERNYNKIIEKKYKRRAK